MRYKAFISYSHAADGKLAPALQQALHRIAKPWYRLRTMRVFRDQTNLATSPGLWTEIEKALRDSEFFIYLASPAAAQSLWVQKEVDWWLTNRSPQTFLIVLTDGAILWDKATQDLDWNTTNALPMRLAATFGEEPLHTDIRWAHGIDQLSLRHSRFRAATLELAATLLGRPKDELDGDDVRQHRRTRRVAWSAIGALAGLLILACLAAWVATQQSLLSTSRSLAARSDAVLPTNPELALLLAREALRFSSDEQVDYALRRAFLRNPLRMFHHEQPGSELVAKFVAANRLLIAEPAKRAVVWSIEQSQPIGEIPIGADDNIDAVSISSEQSLIVVPTVNATFKVYDAKTLKLLASLPGNGPRFSRNGQVLTAWSDGQIYQWGVPSFQERKVSASLPEAYEVRYMSADGNLLVLAQEAEVSAVTVTDAASGKIIASLPESILREGEGVGPDGQFLIVEAMNGETPQLLEMQTGKIRELEKPSFGEIGWTTYVAISPDGKTLVMGNRSGALHSWDIETGSWTGVYDTIHKNDVRSIGFSPDGKSMLSVGVDGNACLWDASDMRCLVVLGGKGDDALEAQFAPDSKHFLTTHADNTVRVWDRESWQPDMTFTAKSGAVTDDGRVVYGQTEEGSVRLWNAEDGKVLTTLAPDADEINKIAVNNSATLAAIAPTEGPVELWDVQAGNPMLRPGGPSAATALAFTGDGSQLATGGEDGKVRFWSVRDGGLLGEWQAAPERVMDIDIQPDNTRVAVATWDGWVRVRDIKTGAVVLEAKLDEEDSVAQVAAFSDDGSLLFLAGDRFPQIWDLASAARVLTLSGHEDDVYGGDFSPDGRFILSASGYLRSRGMVPDIGNGAHLWDARSGRLIVSYLSGYPVQTASFANEGTRLFVGSDYGVMRRYHCEVCLPLEQLDNLAASRLARGLSDEERERYAPNSPILAWIADHMPSMANRHRLIATSP